MKKPVLKYGLISGAVSAAMMLITGLVIKNSGFAYTEYIGYAAMILSFLFIYPGMVAYRDNVGGGQISYGRAFCIGLLITVVSSICYVIAWNIVYHTMIPDFCDKYAAYTIGKMKINGSAQADIDAQLITMQQFKEMYKNPVTMSLLTFTEPLPVGLIISFIAAFTVRLKQKSA